jgi:hypothetical protein
LVIKLILKEEAGKYGKNTAPKCNNWKPFIAVGYRIQSNQCDEKSPLLVQ